MTCPTCKRPAEKVAQTPQMTFWRCAGGHGFSRLKPEWAKVLPAPEGAR